MHLKTHIFVLTAIFCQAVSLSGAVTDEQRLDFCKSQYRYAFECLDSANSKAPSTKTIPRSITPQGELILVAPNDWTSGFFAGSQWYMYELTGDLYWKEKAEKYTHLLESQKFNAGTHDIGFIIYCSYGNGLRLTNSIAYKQILLTAANSLISRFNMNVGSLRSWDHKRDKWEFPVIIDNMMNLELLMWAYRQTGNPLYYQIAVSHAETTMKNHFRADNSSFHVVDYNMKTGAVKKKQTHQGYNDQSIWARGQAWAIYGFSMMYRETKDIRFLEQAKKVLDMMMPHKHMPKDYIPYWDLDAPKIPNEPRDVSAAAIMASALYELQIVDTPNASHYKSLADTIVSNLSANYCSKMGTNQGFLLLHSTGSFPGGYEIDAPLNYADYYFLEALKRKRDTEKTKSH